MSASRRLAKLKRSSMVSDVGNNSIRSTTNNVVNLTNSNEKSDEKSNENPNLVKPVTILTWHEQRLNKIDEDILELKESVNPDLIVTLVETIEQLENKLNLLNDAYDALVKETTKAEVSNEIKKGNTVKLNIKEK